MNSIASSGKKGALPAGLTKVAKFVVCCDLVKTDPHAYHKHVVYHDFFEQSTSPPSRKTGPMPGWIKEQRSTTTKIATTRSCSIGMQPEPKPLMLSHAFRAVRFHTPKGPYHKFALRWQTKLDPPPSPCHIKVRRTHTFKCIHACYASTIFHHTMAVPVAVVRSPAHESGRRDA